MIQVLEQREALKAQVRELEERNAEKNTQIEELEERVMRQNIRLDEMNTERYERERGTPGSQATVPAGRSPKLPDPPY